MEADFSHSLEIESSQSRDCTTKTVSKTPGPGSELWISILLGPCICNAAVQLISDALNIESSLYV